MISITPNSSSYAKLRLPFDGIKYEGKQVHAYSTNKLFNYGFVTPMGSILTVWMLLRTLALCAIATFLVFFRCKTSTGKLNWDFCFPVLASAEGLIFASLVSFLLGLFQTTTFARWWTTREKLGAVMNNINYIAILLSSYVPAHDEHVIAMKARLIRYLNLVHATIYRHANKEFDLADLVQRKLVTFEEAESLSSSPNMPGVAFSWAMDCVGDLGNQNHVSPAAAFAHICTYMNGLYVASQDVAMFLETQLPYSYLHLITLITKIHVVFVVFYAGGIISQGFDTESWTRIIFGYAVVICNTVMYEGLLLIHDMLVNPLGDDIGDFPSKFYLKTTEGFTDYIQQAPRPTRN